MDKDIKGLCERISDLSSDIYEYITSTEHWLLYWISNKEVQDFIKEHPDDYEDMVNLSIININTFVYCKIRFEDHPDGLAYIDRYCILRTFRDTVKARYAEFVDGINEYRIRELREGLAYHKGKVEELEKEIKELEG